MNPFKRFQFNVPKTLLGGRYQVIQALGAGGFGQTFLAADLHLPGHPHCVVKQLKPQSTHPQSLQIASRLFETEAQVLYRLGHHEQIPRLLAHFQDREEFYLVQEWIDGHPLNEELIIGQPWSEEQVIVMLRSLLDGLSYVHQQHVIHRDIKPSNLMRRHSDGKIVLIDFGAVKQVSTQLSHPHAAPSQTIAIGTPGYMPPEQMVGSPRFSSDVYAAGMVAIAALTGISPDQLSQDTHTGEIQWRDRLPNLNPTIATVLAQMICPDFRDRYATAVEALAAIQAISTGSTPVTLPPVLPNLSSYPSVAPTSATWAVPAPNSITSSQPTVYATSSRKTLSLSQVNTIRQLVPARWRESFGKIPHRQILAPVVAIGILGAAYFSWNAGRAPQVSSVSPPSVPTSPSPKPSNPVTELITQADQQRIAEQHASAIETYNQAIALDAKSAQAHWGRCYSLNALQRSKDAIAACETALSLRPDYPEALWSKGYALEQQQQFEQALSLYERAISLKPEFAEAWSNQGTLLLRLGRFEAAIAALDKAIALKPDFAEAWNNRGAALWSVGQIDESIASIDRAIQIRPNYPDALSLRQQIEQKLGSSRSKRNKQKRDNQSKINRTKNTSDDDGDD